MGLFDFVKGAGRKIFGGADEPTAAPASAPSAVDADEARRASNRHRAASLVRFVEGLGLEVSDFSVKVDGDSATLKGSCGSQEIREKVVLAVGNVAGISQVDDQLSVPSAQPEATFYTVVRGDTLSKIAREHYGKASKYMVIFEANKPMLEDPDKIYPGQVLRIPPLEG